MPVHFGDFMLDESRRQLLRGDDPVRLSPKAFQLLSILVHQSPSAVSKRDLQERLWPDTFVSEGNLTTTVGELRAALGENRKQPRFIRTLYGFGYSFAAPVEEAVAKSKRHFPWRTVTAASAIVLVGLTIILSLRGARGSPATAKAPIRSLAVLPFDTSGTDRADQHLGLGLPDLLITRLTNIHQLVIRPTSAIRAYVGRRVDSQDAGMALQVDAVVEGSIRTTADHVRVTVQLLDVHKQKPIWADSFDEKRADMFAIEDKISERVADALITHLTPNERTLLGKRYTADPEAYELYIRARYLDEQMLREGGTPHDDPIRLFQKAVDRDPSYALAWAALAEAYARQGAFDRLPPHFAFQNARAAVDRALQLDDQLSEAHCAAAVIRMYWDLDYRGAEREFARSLQLNPRNAIAMMHYGRLLVCLGRFDEAIAMRKREIEVDPLNPRVQSFLAAAYITARQDDLGIQQCRLVLRMNPNLTDAHVFLARVYALRGEYEKAISEARDAIRTDDGRHGMAFLGYALAKAGRTAEANAILQRLERDDKARPFDLAVVQTGLGHHQEVLQLLEKALSDRTYVLRLKTEPVFEPYHSDPQFQSLLQRAGFGS